MPSEERPYVTATTRLFLLACRMTGRFCHDGDDLAVRDRAPSNSSGITEPRVAFIGQQNKNPHSLRCAGF